MPDYFGRPIRKRGYHRALKRGESWAVRRDTMNKCISLMWENYFKQDNHLMKLVGLEESLNKSTPERDE